jgi:pyruvate/2-oxoglutarate dehydrogenase complex dihydrolipoamide dehydrogenase (E3) component
MNGTYDLIIIGAGSAGLSAATFATQLGARVALIDRDRPGGDCLESGCVPSKTVIKVAKVAWEMRHADRYGLTPVSPEVDLGLVSAHVRATIERVYHFERPEALHATGIAFYAGGARFAGPDTIGVGNQRLSGGRFLVCTGAHAVRPRLPGLEDIAYLTYEDVFRLDRLPPRLVVLGTGPVGVELAQAFGRLGSHVTIVGRSGHLLRQADETIQTLLERILVSEGIDLRLEAAAERVEPSDGGGVRVTTAREVVVGDALLVALGRSPNVDGLDLERAGVAFTTRGIAVDAKLRTSNPLVFACGDVVGGPQFSHYAAWQAYIAVRNALLPGSSHGVRSDVPWAVFTDPEVAVVGLTEKEARLRYGAGVQVAQIDLDHVDRAQTDNTVQGVIKVVLRRDGQILGAHVVAARAGEMIQEYVLAMNNRLSLDRLVGAIHIYPTYSSGNQQVEASYFRQKLLSGLKGRLVRMLLGHPWLQGWS